MCSVCVVCVMCVCVCVCSVCVLCVYLLRSLLTASACYLVAMFEVPFGGEWSLDRLASILGTMFVSAAFGLIYLYTGELAPTTHR